MNVDEVYSPVVEHITDKVFMLSLMKTLFHELVLDILDADRNPNNPNMEGGRVPAGQ